MKLKTILIASTLALSTVAVAAQAGSTMAFTSSLGSTIKATIQGYAGKDIAPNGTTNVPYSLAYTACALAAHTKNCDFKFSINGVTLYDLQGDVTPHSVTITKIVSVDKDYKVSMTEGSVTPPAVGDSITHVWISK